LLSQPNAGKRVGFGRNTRRTAEGKSGERKWTMEKDPVCGMAVNPSEAAAQRRHQGHAYYFCSAGCAAKFDQNPERYANPDSEGKSGSSKQ
jgi:YHS domain-containing protein